MKRIIIVTCFAFCSLVCSAQMMQSVGIPLRFDDIAMGGTDVVRETAMVGKDFSLDCEGNLLKWLPETTDITIYSLSAKGKVTPDLMLGGSFTHNNIPQMELFDDMGSSAGWFSPSEWKVELMGAFKATERITASAKLRYMQSTLAPGRTANHFSADIACLYSFRGVQTGLKVANIGSKVNYGYGAYQLPIVVKAGGLSVLRFSPNHRMEVAADAGCVVNESMSALFAIGTSYTWNRIVTVSCGYNYSANELAVPSYATLGGNVHLWKVRLGAAYISAGNSISFMLGCRL
ncbi:MAG: PorV/PorQ family protein [Bacteroidales bacterium]|nr:PorV/PorQ family protein [Bacteroidales bacterium]